VLTFFAGIETINSRVQLKNLIPRATKTTIKPEMKNTPFDTKKSESSDDNDDTTMGGKQDNSNSKYQTFIYDMMTKIRQIYKVDNRVEILND